MAANFKEWLTQGETLYNAALKEFRELEARLDELETQLAAKQEEVNQIAQMIGKPQVEGSRRLSAELVSARSEENIPAVIERAQQAPTSSSNATIARALTGKFGR